MNEMMINLNEHGIFFEEDEVQWDLDRKDVSYEEVLNALHAGKKIESIAVGSPGDSYYYCETDELQWDLQWEVRVFLNHNKKYALQTYIYASPYYVIDQLDELQEDHEDFEDVAEEIIEHLQGCGYRLYSGDIYAELEGDYTGMSSKEYDTVEEAFRMIPAAFDTFFSYMEAKDQFIYEIIEHYEDEED